MGKPSDLNFPVKPLFVLCLGVQKAGTTWLHHQLYHHPESNLDRCVMKEYQAFQRVGMVVPSRQPEGWNVGLLALGRWGRRWLPLKWGRKWLGLCLLFDRSAKHPALPMEVAKTRRKLRGSVDAYVQHFLEITRSLGAGKRGFVGDFTPGTCLLDEEVLLKLRDGLTEAFDLRVVLLVRDPMERALSAMRMFWKLDRAFFIERKRKIPKAYESLETFFDTWGQSEYFTRASQYQQIVPHCQRIFGKQLLLMRYEDLLLGDQEMRSACATHLLRHLALSEHTFNWKEKINATSPDKSGGLRANQLAWLEGQLTDARKWYDEKNVHRPDVV